MIGVDREVIEHSLSNLPGSTPIIQKERGQAGNRSKEINTLVAKLVDIGFLREAIFLTWIVNLVRVKKHIGSWWVCIVYFDLNNSCLKDH